MGVRVAEMAQDHFTDAFGIAEDVIIPEVKYVELTIAEIAVPIGHRCEARAARRRQTKSAI
jgi:hypothetical protein